MIMTGNNGKRTKRAVSEVYGRIVTKAFLVTSTLTLGCMLVSEVRAALEGLLMGQLPGYLLYVRAMSEID